MSKLIFKNRIKDLTIRHYKNCLVYQKIIDKLGFNKKEKDINNFPFIPVNLFKTLELTSVSKNKIVKVLNSSGTTGTIKSKIYLDRNNSNNQRIVLKEIVQNIIGTERLPMLIIDQNPSLKQNKNMAAKEAGIYGFSMFGKNHQYLLDQNNCINYDNLQSFLNNFSNNKFLMFGFTSNIYKYLIKNFDFNKTQKNDFRNGVLIHGGGWKKMLSKKINNKEFRILLEEKLNLKDIYNYYGLVEQTGSIFFECPKCNLFYTSKYSDIIIRDNKLNVLTKGKGMIQLLSILPTSYPGHNILTEDEGEIINNNCECKKWGKQFKIHGRIKRSEIRGCSDV